MNRYRVTFWISFAIAAGGAYSTTVGSNGLPHEWSGIAALVGGVIVTGAVAGAQAVQKLIEAPPQPPVA